MIELRWLMIDAQDLRDHPSAIAFPRQCGVNQWRVLQYRVFCQVFGHDGSVSQNHPNAHWATWKDVPVVTEP